MSHVPSIGADGSPIHASDVHGADTLSTTISVLEQRLAEKGMDWADIWDSEPSHSEGQVQVVVDGSVSSQAGLAGDEQAAHDTGDAIPTDSAQGDASPDTTAATGEYVTSTVVFTKPQRPVLFLQTIFHPPSPNPCAFASSSHWVSSPTSASTVPPPGVKTRRKRRSDVPSVMRVTNMNTNIVSSPSPSIHGSPMTYIEIARPPRIPSSPATAVRKPTSGIGIGTRYGNLKSRAAERLNNLAIKWRARGRVRSTEVEKTGSWKIE